MALVALLLTTSGCIGFLLGNEPLEFSASNATVGDEALSDTGYEIDNSTTLVENRSVENLGDRRVVAESHVNVYSKSDRFLDEQRQVGMFAVVSVPEVEVLGRSFNPVEDMSNEEMLDRFQSEMSDDYQDANFTAEETKQVDGVLGERANVTRFTGTTEFDGEEIEIAVYVTKVKHEGDWIVMLGAHPTQRPEEEFNVEQLMQSVEHDGDD